MPLTSEELARLRHEQERLLAEMKALQRLTDKLARDSEPPSDEPPPPVAPAIHVLEPAASIVRDDATPVVSPVALPHDMEDVDLDYLGATAGSEFAENSAVTDPVPEPPVEAVTENDPSAQPSAPSVQRIQFLASASEKRLLRITPTFEIEIGMTWTVHIAALLLLSSFIMLGNLTVQSGALALPLKILLMAGIGLSLVIAGLRLSGPLRPAVGASVTPGLRSLGHLFTGCGMACIYYLLYAIHFVPAMRILPSAPAFTLGLLLLWCALMIGYAILRQSQTLAIAAFLCVFYEGMLGETTVFTLALNLCILAATVLTLRERLWATVAFLSLALNYTTHSLWLASVADLLADPASVSLAVLHHSFLAANFSLFLALLLFARPPVFGLRWFNPFAFANIIATAALLLVAAFLRHPYPSSAPWTNLLVFGILLLGAALVTRRFRHDLVNVEFCHLLSATLIIPVALLAGHSSAPQLVSPCLALLLLWLALASGNRRHPSLRLFIHLLALLSAGFALYLVFGLWVIFSPPLDSIILNTQILIAFLVGIFLTAAAILAPPPSADLPVAAPTLPAAAFGSDRPRAARRAPSGLGSTILLTLCALALCLAVIFRTVPLDLAPLAFATLALLATLGSYLWRESVITILFQPLLFLAQILTLPIVAQRLPGLTWRILSVLLISFAIDFLWRRQRITRAWRPLNVTFVWLNGLGFVFVLFFWLRTLVGDDEAWLLIRSVLSTLLLAYGVLERRWPVAVWSQIIMVISVIAFSFQMATGNPWFISAFIPIASLVVSSVILSGSLARWSSASLTANRLDFLRNVSHLYSALALGLYIWWTFKYIPAAYHFAFLVLSAFLLFAANAFAYQGMTLRRARRKLRDYGLWTVATLVLAGFVAFIIAIISDKELLWTVDLVACLSLIAHQQIGKRLRELEGMQQRLHDLMALVAVASLALLVWRSGENVAHGAATSALWAGLALPVFGLGILCGDRIYRVLGLALIGLALLRVTFYDIWLLSLPWRILSFLILSAVLFAIGYVYTKYQSILRRLL